MGILPRGCGVKAPIGLGRAAVASRRFPTGLPVQPVAPGACHIRTTTAQEVAKWRG
jgi:hypothetical protein